jgi:hypothetical protein
MFSHDYLAHGGAVLVELIVFVFAVMVVSGWFSAPTPLRSSSRSEGVRDSARPRWTNHVNQSPDVLRRSMSRPYGLPCWHRPRLDAPTLRRSARLRDRFSRSRVGRAILLPPTNPFEGELP